MLYSATKQSENIIWLMLGVLLSGFPRMKQHIWFPVYIHYYGLCGVCCVKWLFGCYCCYVSWVGLPFLPTTKTFSASKAWHKILYDLFGAKVLKLLPVLSWGLNMLLSAFQYQKRFSTLFSTQACDFLLVLLIVNRLSVVRNF